ncbi:UbiA family prenyltransferase [Pelagovum pacificum]|uniref:UbiA family prenyltransferase n=2 Tax=Pelagovum pacificum TaxID=2588711 RepID=A0A5C5GAT5_9RHOB|nr:UbiA family prenyltransferase [Pelagovum pacificum]QQA41638.1 UbiA family prenyltransferase [Pelagovum pacificum]TNY31070.1 UbiA family prenyltransferase [Pelagovum pacificum]
MSAPIRNNDAHTGRPLVLDADGTLLRTDMMLECFWAGLGTRPIDTLKALRHVGDPARFKSVLAGIAPLRVDLLPVEPEVKALADAARAEGREVAIASASDAALVGPLAAFHKADRAFSSDGQTNLKGPRKAEALVAAYGEGGYDYAGNEPADMGVWTRGKDAITVADPASARTLRAEGRAVTEVKGGWSPADLVRAMRPHQWVKNILLLLPVIAAHDFTLSALLLVLVGMAAFSAAASCIYLVNDLLDLEADRLHPKKKSRPFASGAVPLKVGMVATLGLGAIALSVAAALGPAFLGIVALYMTLSLGYSLKLKRMRWIDIATLASLYTIRVVAGAAASGVDASLFMLIFIFPVFITLGCVKRLTELTLATSDERLPGRGYGRPDRPDLLNMALLGTVGALVIFFAYSFSEQGRALYPDQWLLWVALLPIAWWLSRMVRLGWYGKQDYDPIVFAMKDKRGIGILLITLSLMFYAAGLWQEWATSLFGR